MLASGTPGAGHSAADARQQEMMMFSSLKQNKSFKIYEGVDCADDDEVCGVWCVCARVRVCVCMCACVLACLREARVCPFISVWTLKCVSGLCFRSSLRFGPRPLTARPRPP